MTIDEAIQKFKAYCEGEGDFDELDFKEAILDYFEEKTVEFYKNGYIAGGIDQLNNAVK